MTRVIAGQVFVAGGLPTVTYNPRADLHLEDRLRDYLDERHKILSVSGPTKSGKTVLLKSVITGGVWLAGGEISSISDFWAAVGDKLEVLLEEQIATRDDETTSTATSSGGQIKPFGIGVGVERERAHSNTAPRTRARSGSSRTACSWFSVSARSSRLSCRPRNRRAPRVHMCISLGRRVW